MEKKINLQVLREKPHPEVGHQETCSGQAVNAVCGLSAKQQQGLGHPEVNIWRRSRLLAFRKWVRGKYACSQWAGIIDLLLVYY